MSHWQSPATASLKAVLPRSGIGLHGRIGNKFPRAGPGDGGSVNGKTITVLGVTFKPNTDDTRDARALTIVPALIGGGAKVRVVDPEGRREGEHMLPGITWTDDPYKAAEGAHAVVILTEWNEFRALDLGRLAGAMETPRPPISATSAQQDAEERPASNTWPSVADPPPRRRAQLETRRSVSWPMAPGETCCERA